MSPVSAVFQVLKYTLLGAGNTAESKSTDIPAGMEFKNQIPSSDTFK